MTSPERPRALTLGALVLGWAGLTALALAVAVLTIPEFGRAAWLLAAVGLWFGLSAIASAVGLWRRRRWARLTLEAWRVGAFLAAVTPTLLFTTAGYPMPAWQPPLIAVLAFVVASFVVTKLRRLLPPAA
ncbi:MAG TPA: hypothetical protein VFS40_07005 [Gemmatimonadales bacterium]|nr:hypothetical protein [Gemmatimonadales bacterium]